MEVDRNTTPCIACCGKMLTVVEAEQALAAANVALSNIAVSAPNNCAFEAISWLGDYGNSEELRAAEGRRETLRRITGE